MEATEMNSVTPAQESEHQISTSAAEQNINVIAKIRSKCKRLTINKALIPLKIAIFFWYGGCPILFTFLPVYFAQLGLSVYQLALINIAVLPFKFLGPIIAGMIADKTGRSKPVLYANITFVLIFVNTMLLIPKVEYEKCEGFSAEINCSAITNITNRVSDFNTSTFSIITNLDVRSCDVQCPLEGLSKSTFRPKSIPTSNGTNGTKRVSSRAEQQFMCCIYGNISSNSSVKYNNTFIIKNLNFSKCENVLSCNFKCFKEIGENCDVSQSSNMTFVFILSFVILSLYTCVLSCCYRFMDVLCMTMVKKHGSDYGRQALWGNLGICVLSPLCGHVIKLTARTGAIENYASAIYVFDGTALITLMIVMKLDIEINSPSRKMCKKALSLIQNPDVLIFFLLLIILGTSWFFAISFSSLYLHGLNAPSLLIGVLPGVNSLVALPFLATSNWWVKKIGSSNLLLLALVSYILHGIGYSFLVNPWHALICELLGVFTYHLAWVAAVRHSYDLAPKGLMATTVATAGSLFYGIGSGTGSAVGLIMGQYGGKTAFRFVASMCGITAILFIMFRYLRRRRQNIGSDIKSDTAP